MSVPIQDSFQLEEPIAVK